MKKIYLLLSATACLFAFNANAADELVSDNSGWAVSGSTVGYKIADDGKQIDVFFTAVKAAGEEKQWDAQFITPSWQNAGQEGDSFKLSFDVKYSGDADAGSFRIASGKTFPWDENYNQGGNTQIVDEDGNKVVYAPDTLVSKEWKRYEYSYFLGEEGADSVRLEIDFGAVVGTLSFKNIVLEVGGKVINSYYGEAPTTTPETPTTTPETPAAVEGTISTTDALPAGLLADGSGWVVDGGNSTYKLTQFTDAKTGQVSNTMIEIIFNSPKAAGEEKQWDAQFITPSWKNAGKEGDSFKLSFDVKYTGDADAGSFRIASGKTYPWDENYNQGGNTQIVDEDGNKVVYAPDTLVSKEWKRYEYSYFLGEEGADSVRLEIDHGAVSGTISIKNVVVEVGGKVIAKYFTEVNATTPITAVEEVAAINAYVADGVLYASEAVDVVIYNISGVAVKVAKNVTTLNVADLKSGLYIAKVGNKAIKFVK